jgi:hypothetical protein
VKRENLKGILLLTAILLFNRNLHFYYSVYKKIDFGIFLRLCVFIMELTNRNKNFGAGLLLRDAGATLTHSTGKH